MDLLQYKIWLLIEEEDKKISIYTTIFQCRAFTETDAIEKAEDRYPNCTIIACERMEYPSPF